MQIRHRSFAPGAHALTALCIAAGISSGTAAPQPALPSSKPGAWKTAYFKRGFVGPLPAADAGGVNSTLRNRVVIPFDGTKVRVFLGPMWEGETAVSKITLARGKEGGAPGTIEGTPVAINFTGVPTTTVAAKVGKAKSDAAVADIRRGVWYVQQSYSSEKFAYAYNVDSFFYEAGDHHSAATLAHSTKGGMWPGNLYRIDVFTTDTRPTILCYGDSITHGYHSTPNAGKAYPEVLGHLTGFPTLNLGVNGDVITQTGGAPATINSCKGVKSVIVLMGINDIIGGRIKTSAAYAKVASALIAGIKRDGKKVLIGTITPASGNKAFDKSPEKEKVRQEINTWIRKESKCDGVIDFDAALRDPENPSRLKAEYESDWLHPNDAGYQKMAEAAAAFFPKSP